MVLKEDSCPVLVMCMNGCIGPERRQIVTSFMALGAYDNVPFMNDLERRETY